MGRRSAYFKPYFHCGNGKWNIWLKGCDTPAYHASISYLAPTDDGASLKAAGANNLHILEIDSTLYDTNFITGVKADVGIASGTWLFLVGLELQVGVHPLHLRRMYNFIFPYHLL